jgi:hypothetical protein
VANTSRISIKLTGAHRVEKSLGTVRAGLFDDLIIPYLQHLSGPDSQNKLPPGSSGDNYDVFRRTRRKQCKKQRNSFKKNGDLEIIDW